MFSQFPPALIERGRALRSAFPLDNDGRWALSDLVVEVVGDVPKAGRSGLMQVFSVEVDIKYNVLLHHFYTGKDWPLEHRNSAHTYAQHERRNKLATHARTEEDWANLWGVKLSPKVTGKPGQSQKFSFEQLLDPTVTKAMRRWAADDKKRLAAEEAERVAEAVRGNRLAAARREANRADKERQRLEKLGANNAIDFYNQAYTRLAKLPVEVTMVEEAARFMTPYMRGELLRLIEQVDKELHRSISAIKNIERIEASKRLAASTPYEDEAISALAFADRLANGGPPTQYGVRVNLSPDDQAQGKHASTGLPTPSA